MGELATIPEKRPVGAPTLYKSEYCERIIEHFNAPRPEVKTAIGESETDDGKWKREYRVICGEIPTLLSFGAEIGVSPQTLSTWQNRHPEFREACARAKGIGAAILSERTLNGRYNAQFAQFFAKNVYGWSDKIEIDQTVTAGEDTLQAAKLRDMLAAATPDELRGIGDIFAAIEARQTSRAALPESTT